MVVQGHLFDLTFRIMKGLRSTDKMGWGSLLYCGDDMPASKSEQVTQMNHRTLHDY